MLKKILCGLTLSLLAAASPRVATLAASAQTTAEWLRRQQQQQQQQRQQQQQQEWLRRQREQEAQRQQMREQQRQQMQQRLREQQQQQLRQRQQQQRQQVQQQQQRRPASGRAGGAAAARGTGVRSANASGVARLTRPPTPAEIRRGFTGRVTADGRALVRFNGRTYAVPAARAGIRINTLRVAPQSSRWSATKRAAISAEIQKLASASLKGRGGAAGGGRRPPGGGGSGGPPERGRVPIQFGHVPNNISHAFRYTDGIGLDREVVKEAIRGDLAKVADDLPKGVHYNGSVLVGERLLVYSAFKLPNGTINVGSIKPQ